MRSHSLASVVLAGLAIAVLLTLGCTNSPTGPSQPLSISPRRGPAIGANVVTISGPGAGFQSGAAVTVDGTSVNATILSANAISIVMPAHAGGSVEVAVIRVPGQAPSKVGEYTYVGPPVISEIFPNTGSTGGGTPLSIEVIGDAKTVTIGGIASTFQREWDEPIYLSTPAHADGSVEVIVTDEYGQSGRATFTYASPATFDANGDWKGWATGQPGQSEVPVVLTIRDNLVVGVSCGNSLLTPEAPLVVANGEFSFAEAGVNVTGKILSPIHASGSINMPTCGNRQWSAQKK